MNTRTHTSTADSEAAARMYQMDFDEIEARTFGQPEVKIISEVLPKSWQEYMETLNSENVQLRRENIRLRETLKLVIGGVLCAGIGLLVVNWL